MNSSATHQSTGRDQMVPKQCNTIIPATTKHASSRRTPSFSSSSSSSSHGSSYYPDDPPLSPATPLRFSGVPFSWEHFPGIPKKLQNQKKKESMKLLPLPPPATPPTSKKYFNISEDIFSGRRKASATADSFRKDPFFAALVECSKDDHEEEHESATSASNLWTGAKVTRSISDRFGFINLYMTSCKRTCAVSESIVYLPRSGRSTANYGLINRRSC